MKAVIITASAASVFVMAVTAPPALADEAKQIDVLLIHPPFNAAYSCSEHWEGQLPYLGDALGSDCYVTELVENANGGSFARAFRNDGMRNEDWYSWGREVLAPFDGVVARVMINDVVNEPGLLGKPPASLVIFKNDRGENVMIGHIADVTVQEGDAVKAGQVFAVVGNNGYGRNPHLHIGAWRDKEPLQLRHDLRARGRMMTEPKPAESE